MMALQAISARDVGQGPSRVRFDFRPGGTVSYQKQAGDTEASFTQELVGQLEQRGLSDLMPPFFIHFNADGSVAVATGEEPVVWPEDEV